MTFASDGTRTLGHRKFDPYVGPEPFHREDAWRFFGRIDAAQELLSLVLASRTSLLYAQSGAGKSSLVNAGLLPLLEKKEFDVLPPARVQGGLPIGLSPAQLGNPYTYFTLTSWGEQPPLGPPVFSIAEALARRPRPNDKYGDPASRLMVFDQFEELFTSFPESWPQRPKFVEELVAALAADERLHLLFVVREEHLADVLTIGEDLPDGLRSRFRLPRLGKEEALQAVEGPLRGTDRSYESGVASRLVDDLTAMRVETAPGNAVEVAGEFVEPVQLQVVLTRLWQSLPAGTTMITTNHVRTFGDITTALAGYYDDVIAETARQTAISPVALRRWFGEVLITPARTRGTAYRGKESTAKLPNTAVDVLEDLHMIRAETRAGARWYELTHDRFIGPVQESNSRNRWTRRDAYGVTALAAAGSLALPNALLRRDLDGHSGVAFRFVVAGLATFGTISVVRTLLRQWRRVRSTSTLFRVATTGMFILVAFFGVSLGALVLQNGWDELVGSPYDHYSVAYADFTHRNLNDPPCHGSTLRIFADHGSPPSSTNHPEEAWCFYQASSISIAGLANASAGAAIVVLAVWPLIGELSAGRTRRRSKKRRPRPSEVRVGPGRNVRRSRPLGSAFHRRSGPTLARAAPAFAVGMIATGLISLAGVYFVGHGEDGLPRAPRAGNAGSQAAVFQQSYLFNRLPHASSSTCAPSDMPLGKLSGFSGLDADTRALAKFRCVPNGPTGGLVLSEVYYFLYPTLDTMTKIFSKWIEPYELSVGDCTHSQGIASYFLAPKRTGQLACVDGTYWWTDNDLMIVATVQGFTSTGATIAEFSGLHKWWTAQASSSG